MKTKLFSVEKVAWMMLILHSILVVVVFAISFLPSGNPDSSIAFVLIIITEYFIDLPVGMLFEKIGRPNLGSNYLVRIVSTFSWFFFLGGSYWFCIGVITRRIIWRIRKQRGRL